MEWVKPKIEELILQETSYGGREGGYYDDLWMDEQGMVHSTFCCS